MAHLSPLILLFAGMVQLVVGEPGGQAPNDDCAEFMSNGTSGPVWYVCCNNCISPNHVCNGTDYQQPNIHADNCDGCGISQGGDVLNIHDAYNCGGCNGQTTVQNDCVKAISPVLDSVPSNCWLYTKCFHLRCAAKFVFVKSIPNTCFNMACDNGETIENCPTDCCYQQNPGMCSWNNTANSCLPECCSESSCCPPNTTTPPTGGACAVWPQSLLFTVIALYVFAVVTRYHM